MRGFLKKFFSPEPAPSASIPAASPSIDITRAPRAIAFDPRLVPELKHDHVELVELFGQIGQAAERQQFDRVPVLLVSFKTRLEGHLLAENVRFYNYVENSLQGDEDNSLLIRSFRREMNSIARGVVEFVKKYQLAHFDVDTRAQFLTDYRAVGGLLTQRIEREEASLYPLYQP